MAERKTPAAKTTAAEKPAGRFYDLQQEVTIPTPYLLTEDIVIPPLTRRQFIDVEKATTEEAAERAILGDHYEAVVELYLDRPMVEWQAFTRDLNRHMFGLSAEQAPGKSEESSSS